MRRIKNILQVSTLALALCGMLTVFPKTLVRAESAPAPSLILSQLKVTASNGQFVTLYNTGDSALDASKFQLEYFNSYDLSKATSSKLVALTGSIPPHGYFTVSDDSMVICYRQVVDSASLGFSSTAGFLELIASTQTVTGGLISPVVQDYVGWSKTATAGVQTLPTGTAAYLMRQPVDSQGNPSVSMPGAGTWQSVQPGSASVCTVNVSGSTNSGPNIDAASAAGLLLPTAQPPATIESVSSTAASTTAGPVMPKSDIGLMAPQVTELLPNPVGTGNDGTDEYIELYNSNSADFDLSGFILQTGLTTYHHYTFPSGTKLAPHTFVAFYSATTKLSLSNTTGQAQLLDPFGNKLSGSGIYPAADDGLAWALANGNWYFTSQPTPSKANVIKGVPGKTSTKKSKAATTTSKSSGGASAAIGRSAAGSEDITQSVPVHVWVLALIGGVALLYGAYEYRADLRNFFYRLRRHAGNRESDGQQA